MNAFCRYFLFSLFLIVQPVRVSAEDGALSVEDLARALGVNWTSMTLPGTEDDVYYAGAIVEFGDGSKSMKSGMTGPIKGGSVLKFLVRVEGEKLKTTILAGSHSSTVIFENPFEKYSNIMGMSSSLAPPFSEIDYLKKGSRDRSASIGGPKALQEEEAGVRVYIELQNKE